MGLFSRQIKTTYAQRPSLPTMPATPFDPQDSLLPAIVGEIFGVDTEAVTREIAMRVPGLKRAVQVHASIVSAMPLVAYRKGVPLDPQPEWLQNTQSGIAPSIRTKGLVTDLVLEGWALLGCQLDDNERIIDAIHIPRNMWKFDSDGYVSIERFVDPRYLKRLIPIPLGTNGVLVDGVDTIRQARALDLARTNRLQAPPAGTELHITDESYNGDEDEKKKLAQGYAETRRKFSVSVTPSNVEVKEHGDKAVDLFDSATNSIRLDIANHAGVPAAIIEGARSGSGGDMTYTGKGDARSELYDLGSRDYADAIAARLSLDDVSEPGVYIAFDRSDAFSVPTPVTPPVLED
ncbi:hypothetical protein [Microbacterium sp. T2.11-28]|uniref:hypothetical protein n=1 Tax=Microbacterium sp. T2.11-28 TaxID=3041169 RepID=UPI00247735E0|nr:hypothetical protein [Microbacterium sp. T2.11-28]CAI9386083.1 hypothetical protein MICABA_00163 [Microbacterium sp. T2.11-28]